METKELVTCAYCAGIGQIRVHFEAVPPQGGLPGTPAIDKILECRECKGRGTRLESYYLGGIEINKLHSATNKGTVSRVPTSIILVNTDGDEYTALSADKKEIYKIYISAGTLDMSVGAPAHDIFLAWFFPPGKKTYTDITAALAALG